jgi:hypothetical protein
MPGSLPAACGAQTAFHLLCPFEAGRLVECAATRSPPCAPLLFISAHLQAEPFVVEALFPLFELLHHYWINQADRDSTLQELGRLLAPAVFGTPAEHGLPAEDAGLLSDTGAAAGRCARAVSVLCGPLAVEQSPWRRPPCPPSALKC